MDGPQDGGYLDELIAWMDEWLQGWLVARWMSRSMNACLTWMAECWKAG